MNKRIVLSIILAVFAGLSAGRVSVAAPDNPNRPKSLVDVFGPPKILAPGVACDFGVEFAAAGGKIKDIVSPDGVRVIEIYPGAKARITNLSNSKSVTLNISGSLHVTTNPDGSWKWVVSDGRSTYWDEQTHLVLLIGHFAWGFDDAGQFVPASGQGNRVEVCPMIS